MTIENRLDFLLQGRNIYPWAESIGLRGPIEGMRYKKSVPGGETLVAIRKCENVRIDWLLEGSGEPYITSKVLNDTDAIELITELFAESWTIYLLTNQTRIAIVLTRPGSYQVKDGKDENGEQQYRWVNYSNIELIVGFIGSRTIAFLQHQATTNEVRLVDISDAQMTALEKGMIGTYLLTKSPDGILSNYQIIDEKHPIFSQPGQQTLFSYTDAEIQLLKHYREISEEGKNAVTQVINVMTHPK